jgi:hypothetical protein
MKKVKVHAGFDRHRSLVQSLKHTNYSRTHKINMLVAVDINKSTVLESFNAGFPVIFFSKSEGCERAPVEVSDPPVIGHTRHSCGQLCGPPNPDSYVKKVSNARTALWFNASNILDTYFQSKYDGIQKEFI